MLYHTGNEFPTVGSTSLLLQGGVSGHGGRRNSTSVDMVRHNSREDSRAV